MQKTPSCIAAVAIACLCPVLMVAHELAQAASASVSDGVSLPEKPAVETAVESKNSAQKTAKTAAAERGFSLFLEPTEAFYFSFFENGAALFWQQPPAEHRPPSALFSIQKVQKSSPNARFSAKIRCVSVARRLSKKLASGFGFIPQDRSAQLADGSDLKKNKVPADSDGSDAKRFSAK